MAKKSNNNLIIGIGAAVVVVLVAVGVIIGINAGKGGGESGGGDSDNGSNTSQNTGGLSKSDLANIDVYVPYGDYDGMQTLSKDIQNGYATGKVVKIDGLVSKPMSSYSIVQASSDGTKKIGTQFIIEGGSESNYPKDGDRVEIVGKVVENSPLVFIIKTLPEYVTAK